MSFGRELKDFVSGFSSGTQLYQGMARSRYYGALADQTLANIGNKPPAVDATKDVPEGGNPIETDAAPGPGTPGGASGSSNTQKNNSAGGSVDSSGRTVNYASVATHGDPNDPAWAKNNLVTVAAPNGAKFQVHKDAAGDFSSFLKDLHTEGYDIKSSGGYNNRNIAGTKTPSQHAFANAIDINAAKNGRGVTQGDMPKNVNELADRNNLTWGGNWKNPDPMHFEWRGPRATASQPASPPARQRMGGQGNDQVGALETEDDVQAGYTGGMIKAYSRGGAVTPAYSRGGMGINPAIDDQPQTGYGPTGEDTEDDAILDQATAANQAQGQPRPTQVAYNDKGGAPSGNVLSDALHGGLTWMQEHFGLGNQGAAVGADPKLQQAQRRFMSGEGAASPEDVASVRKAVDPNGQMTTAQRNIYVLEKTYEWYRQRGDYDAANRTAAMLIQASGDEASKLGHAAVQAGQRGDVKGMVENAKRAYEATPDGHDADATIRPDGNIDITRKDARTGKPTGTMTVTPRQLFNAAVGLSNKSGYYEQIMHAAAQHTEKSPAYRTQRDAAAAGLVDEFRAAGQADPSAEKQQAGKPAVPAAPANPAPANPPPAPAQTGPKPVQTASLEVPVVPGAPAVGTDAAPAAAPAPASPAPAPAPASAVGGAPPPESPDGPAPSMATPASATSAPAVGGGDSLPEATASPQLARPPITPFEQISPRPQMNEAQTRALNKLAATNAAAARALYSEWKSANLDPWTEQKKAYETEARRQADVSYTQSHEDLRSSNNNASADRRETFSQRQQNQRLQFQEGQNNARLAQQQEHDRLQQQERENQAKRMEYYKNSKPISVNDLMRKDEDQEAFHARINKSIMNNILSTYRNDDGTMRARPDDSTGQPIDEKWVLKRFGSQALQGIRDTTVELMRYNGNISPDTASAIVLEMTRPGAADKGGNATPYVTAKLPGVPGDTDDRMLVKFRGKNPLFKSVVLPGEMVDNMDVIRGQQLKREFGDLQLTAHEASQTSKLKELEANQAAKQQWYADHRHEAVIPMDGALTLSPKPEGMPGGRPPSFGTKSAPVLPY